MRLLLPALAGLVVLFVVLEFTIPGTKEDDKPTMKPGTVKSAELTETEKNLLFAGGAKSIFAFDYRVPTETINELKVWIDHYEDGKKREPLISHSTEVVSRSGRIIATFQEMSLTNDTVAKWVLTTAEEKERSHVAYVRKQPSTSGIKATLKRAQTMKIKSAEPIILAVIVKDTDAASISVGGGVFQDPTELQSVIHRYQSVYVLRCRFR
ncbi:MAG TPA: hypothetical protein VFK44_09760 [Bacillales bacterium]|nr:hypothetical protein [Bacillales bacterium]